MFHPQMKKLFGFIDTNRETFIQNLAEVIAIKSVSAWPEAREVRQMVLLEVCKSTDLARILQDC
jgi:hypothetical protein